MAQQPNFNAKQATQDLLERKLGALASWKIPALVNTIGPCDMSPFEAYKSEIDQVRLDCEQLLDGFTDEELRAIFERRGDDVPDAKNMWFNKHRTKIDDLKKNPPAWYEGGYGHPDYAADFENWCKMPRFTIDEALSLATGIEPGHIPLKDLEAMSRRGLQELEGPRRYLLIRYEQVKRQFAIYGLDATLLPRKLLEWSRQVEFEMHPQFDKLLRTYHGSEEQKPISPNVAGEKPDKREIDTMAKLFTVMAIDNLGFVPHQSKSPIPKQIVEFAATQGINVSVETVRKYLRRGALFLPKDREDD